MTACPAVDLGFGPLLVNRSTEVEVVNMLFVVHVDQYQRIASATEDARDARNR